MAGLCVVEAAKVCLPPSPACFAPGAGPLQVGDGAGNGSHRNARHDRRLALVERDQAVHSDTLTMVPAGARRDCDVDTTSLVGEKPPQLRRASMAKNGKFVGEDGCEPLAMTFQPLPPHCID